MKASRKDDSSLDAMRETAPLIFLGRRSLTKLYLMLHFGRMLTAAGSVRLDAVNPCLQEPTLHEHCGMVIHEHPEIQSLHEALCETKPADGTIPDVRNRKECSADRRAFHLVDMPGSVSVPENSQVILVMEPDRNNVEEGLEFLRETGRKSGRFRLHRVYLDLCESSRIGARYLETLVERGLPPLVHQGAWMALAMDERSRAALLDNQHDDRLSIRPLGPVYHRLLSELAYAVYGIGLKDSRKWMRAVDRKR